MRLAVGLFGVIAVAAGVVADAWLVILIVNQLQR